MQTHESVRPATTHRAVQPADAQRRAHARIEAEFEVTFAGENNFYMGFSENISEGGLFVATAELLCVGQQLTVKFTLPGIEAPCELLCVVRWIRQPPVWSHEMPGMGLQFQTIDDPTRALIERFLAKRPPLFVDDDAMSGSP